LDLSRDSEPHGGQLPEAEWHLCLVTNLALLADCNALLGRNQEPSFSHGEQYPALTELWIVVESWTALADSSAQPAVRWVAGGFGVQG
jgi:hypothetical protein